MLWLVSNCFLFHFDSKYCARCSSNCFCQIIITLTCFLAVLLIFFVCSMELYTVCSSIFRLCRSILLLTLFTNEIELIFSSAIVIYRESFCRPSFVYFLINGRPCLRAATFLLHVYQLMKTKTETMKSMHDVC